MTKPTEEQLQTFIDSMEWSDQTSDEVKTLVLGNVRGYHAFLLSQQEEDPTLCWNKLPCLPAIRPNRFSSWPVLVQLDNGNMFAGHYHENGCFYAECSTHEDNWARGVRVPNTGFAHAWPKRQAVRWAYIQPPEQRHA